MLEQITTTTTTMKNDTTTTKDDTTTTTIIAWVNFATLVLSSFIFTYYYVKSVSPAALEKKIGSQAWDGRCAWYRIIASVFMIVGAGNYILYHWYPLHVPPIALIPLEFPWDYKVSASIALVLGIPCFLLMIIGVWHAGEETMTPKKEHSMHGGIYNYIRHPQALGEWPLWWVIALAVNSPFLALFSFLYIPVWAYFCIAEENDLLLRYGKTYQDYQRRVGFWFPKIGRVVSAVEKSD